MKYTICFILLCTSAQVYAQVIIDAVPNYFGVDTNHKIIVWNQSHLDSVPFDKNAAVDIRFNNEVYHLTTLGAPLKQNARYQLIKQSDTFKLYISSFPIINIKSDDSIVNEPKINAKISYADYVLNIESDIGIELRGNSALHYPKKSYDMELREEATSEKSKDAKLASLRKDDDWQLNSMFNEPLKLRSYFANKLWLDIHTPFYSEDKKKAKSGIDLAYSEVFLNNTYQGLYSLNEQVDRKQLRLKKIDSLGKVQGELFKASSYQDNTSFKAAPSYRNIFPHFGGFSVKYPYENYEAHWEDLHAFVNFVATADNVIFSAEIEQRFYIDNAIDYFLLTNLLRATDNLGKNYFLARYKKDSPYFFVPWDLDGILGIIQDGKRISTTDDILSNNLFDRLKETNAANYNERLNARWIELRSEAFSNSALEEKLHNYYHKFTESGLYERESMVWPQEIPREDDYQYMMSWLEKRLEYLDTYFKVD